MADPGTGEMDRLLCGPGQTSVCRRLEAICRASTAFLPESGCKESLTIFGDSALLLNGLGADYGCS
jgi:hypothetical protein